MRGRSRELNGCLYPTLPSPYKGEEKRTKPGASASPFSSLEVQVARLHERFPGPVAAVADNLGAQNCHNISFEFHYY